MIDSRPPVQKFPRRFWTANTIELGLAVYNRLVSRPLPGEGREQK